ncbi:mechanosensitive ion channel family protein [Ruegeria sp. PrR005]|uniref:Mechanosensitive ion channel family protein n=1 Tax=Ruegeria sp. PrR005 TaxID=2706882 RepID=A0A6B2NMS0_9RHOB|nr:mechanosensitive ion channel family protein [Ruegeria sp. PrR005]NDW44668.1 mechanosensitive ion channel family protein [Ruegeria sp. PrR005]
MQKPKGLYWWFLGFISVTLFGLELVFDDVLLTSKTDEITSTTKVLIVLLGGSIVVLIVLTLLRRYLLWQQIERSTLEGTDRIQSSRALSVVPLVRAILISFTVVIAGLTALSEAGVNIGPMLAGAGIVGIVLGMGAQSLLRDILAGLFFVFDDAFRIGEYVEIGERRGTVENISLRSMQIRHHRGALQTIPYGKIDAVSNLSRDWTVTKLNFHLPQDTNIMKVKEIVKRVSAELMKHEELGPTFIAPLKFQGIYDIDLYGLTVRVKFTSIPGEQFTARREIYSRLKEAFAENGIEFARRSVAIEGSHLSDEPSIRVAAAAEDTENSVESFPSVSSAARNSGE